MVDKICNNIYLDEHGGGALVGYHFSYPQQLTVDDFMSTTNTTRYRNVLLIFDGEGNVTDLSAVGTVCINRTGLSVTGGRTNPEIGVYDFSQKIYDDLLG